jgi:hypothetical protein
MYQAYPGGAEMPQDERLPAPRSVLTAVKLMYAGAAVSVVGLVLSLATIGSVKTALRSAYPHYTAAQLHGAEIVAISSVVVESLISVGLWVWMAWANKRGKNWARIVASVLFGLNTLLLLLTVGRPHSAVGLLYYALLWLIGLGAIVLLWQRDSSAYFASGRARARQR